MKPQPHPTRHARFVAEYLIDFNGAKAAVRAGYSAKRAKQTAYDLLARDDVAAAIAAAQQQIAARATVTVDEIVAALTGVLRANMADYMRGTEDGTPVLDFTQLTREQAGQLAEVTVETHGADTGPVCKVKFKLHDKLSAADKLLRHLGGYAPTEVITKNYDVSSEPVTDEEWVSKHTTEH